MSISIPRSFALILIFPTVIPPVAASYPVGNLGLTEEKAFVHLGAESVAGESVASFFFHFFRFRGAVVPGRSSVTPEVILTLVIGYKRNKNKKTNTNTKTNVQTGESGVAQRSISEDPF